MKMMNFKDCKTEQELIDRLISYVKSGYLTRRSASILGIELLSASIDEEFILRDDYIPPETSFGHVIIADFARKCSKEIYSC